MKLKINIPEKLGDIPLRNYQSFLSVENPTEKDFLKHFYGINDLVTVKQKDVAELVNAVNKCFDNKPKKLIKTFTLNGVEYGFIPKLDDISYGENLDVTEYINNPETLHKAMAVLYRPIIKKQFNKYLIEPYEGSQKFSALFKQMPLDVVFSAQVFFYNLMNELLNCTPVFLKEESQQISAESGENMQRYINSLTENLRKLNELRLTTFTKL